MDAREDLNREKLVDLMATASETEANIVRGLLEASQIRCALITPVPHNLYPFTVNGLALIKIKVLASDLEAAKSLLEGHEMSALSDGGDST